MPKTTKQKTIELNRKVIEDKSKQIDSMKKELDKVVIQNGKYQAELKQKDETIKILNHQCSELIKRIDGIAVLSRR
jgi:hypothetical protein